MKAGTSHAGSTADAVIRKSQVPVLVFPFDSDDE